MHLCNNNFITHLRLKFLLANQNDELKILQRLRSKWEIKNQYRLAREMQEKKWLDEPNLLLWYSTGQSFQRKSSITRQAVIHNKTQYPN